MPLWSSCGVVTPASSCNCAGGRTTGSPPLTGCVTSEHARQRNRHPWGLRSYTRCHCAPLCVRPLLSSPLAPPCRQSRCSSPVVIGSRQSDCDCVSQAVLALVQGRQDRPDSPRQSPSSCAPAALCRCACHAQWPAADAGHEVLLGNSAGTAAQRSVSRTHTVKSLGFAADRVALTKEGGGVVAVAPIMFVCLEWG
jgi:hypothetical protein